MNVEVKGSEGKGMKEGRKEWAGIVLVSISLLTTLLTTLLNSLHCLSSV